MKGFLVTNRLHEQIFKAKFHDHMKFFDDIKAHMKMSAIIYI